MLANPNALLSTDSSSMKLYASGSGTITVPSGTNVSSSAVIPHNYGDTNLLWQVVLTETDGSATNSFSTPFLSNDSRIKGTSTLDATNLTIAIVLSSATSAWPQTTWNYVYRILIP